MRRTQLLILGAGPFGLSMAAYARQNGLDFLHLGRPCDFWKNNMPRGMFLRSGIDWQLDPRGEFSLERFVREQDIRAYSPLPLDIYWQYLDWFMTMTRLDPLPVLVRMLRRSGQGFLAELEDGTSIEARQVVLATGFRYFAHFPEALVRRLPPGRFSHTCTTVDPAPWAGQRLLILGGRQSAFETAAIFRENGVGPIHLSYRHDTPRFEEADWTWVSALIDRVEHNPAWFRNLPAAEKEAYRYKFWAEGRLKIEPWLESRIAQPHIVLHPRTELLHSRVLKNNALQVELSNQKSIEVDHILLATGYQVQVRNLPFLDPGLLDAIRTDHGYPVLDEHFQSSVPGLYASSFMATQDFGPFMAFTISAPMAARLIGKHLKA